MPDTVPRAPVMTSSGSFSKCPQCLLLGQGLRPPDESGPGTVLKELPVWGAGEKTWEEQFCVFNAQPLEDDRKSAREA